ncbi:cytochrome b [Psychromonas ossibalaenae]|uniref:cytochrome b n=1 Tax=Psychromonas ossibalaenae TaxID=444922 RepID=UPI00037A9393|nr:cytochrome b [Psychromonas ossibalaenae]
MKVSVPTEHFSSASKIIHIVSAAAFIVSMLLILVNSDPDSSAFALHQSLGIVVLLSYVVRIIWLNWTGHPKPLGTKFEKFVAAMAHTVMYAIVLLMPLTGLLISLAKAKDTVVFGMFTIPGFAERNAGLIDVASTAHSFLEIVCYILVFAHIAGTSYHHFVLKDSTLTRMMGRKNNDN